MKQFNYFAPTSLEQATELLKGANENTHIIAGGTDMIVQIHQKMVSPEMIVNLKKVKELNYIKEEDGFIKIGAVTTFTELERSELLNKKAKVLAQACREVGSTQIRNLGTIGGNVVNASAAGDSITALIALDASVVLKSANGERTMKLEEFYQGAGSSQIRKDEILTEFFFEVPGENTVSSFKKLGKRKALAIVVLSVGAVVEKEPGQNKCKNVQISLGAVSRYSMRARDAEKLLIGQELSQENIEKCIQKISEIAEDSILNSPFKDLAPYKRESIKGVAREAFTNILKELN